MIGDLRAKGLQGVKADILTKVSKTPRQWKSMCIELNINEIKKQFIPGNIQELVKDTIVSLVPRPTLGSNTESHT